ncbi:MULTISPECIES: alpha/beta hydrolase [unclassified Beijerinckia]|uniref:alpha/beta fold hydrolase n=1 Tax=unclassified Beijerinckia TaxID=2638183 RepID=UPI00089A2976|nr:MULTISPECIES: alpha/beta hydrolase [unclassified Beijerinckia]MDH7796762.1 pimeloyl-ACP methyl ester carboxylesterase [Beijerinckia sp. GAS462]SEC58816.1 Pimeloyl-ACP methyl ester carboxylesterase [Beijerinckia sp. 28-YEA-48]
MTDISFTERDIALSSGSLRVRTAGKGRPLLHLHSAAGPRVSGMVEALADHHLVHAPVLPGFDGTAKHSSVTTMTGLADLMAEFITKECGGEADIVGEGLGGWVGLWLAQRHPALIGLLVLEAPAGLRRDELIARPANDEERLQLLHAVSANVPKETRTPQMLQNNRKALQDYTQGVDFDEALAARLGEIKARALILMGALDKMVPRETGHILKAGIPQSHLTYIWGAAHAIEFDQPQRTSALVLDFLDRGESFLVRQAAGAA